MIGELTKGGWTADACHIYFTAYLRLTRILSDAHGRDTNEGKLNNYINQYHSEPLQRVPGSIWLIFR